MGKIITNDEMMALEKANPPSPSAMKAAPKKIITAAEMAKMEQMEKVGPVDLVTNALSQGLTLGGGDEAIARGYSALGMGTTEENMKELAARKEALQEKYPKAYPALDIAGSLVGPGKFVKGIPSAMALGGAEGFLRSEDTLKENPTGVALDTAVGTGLGAAGQKIGELAQPYIKKGAELAEPYVKPVVEAVEPYVKKAGEAVKGAAKWMGRLGAPEASLEDIVGLTKIEKEAASKGIGTENITKNISNLKDEGVLKNTWSSKGLLDNINAKIDTLDNSIDTKLNTLPGLPDAAKSRVQMKLTGKDNLGMTADGLLWKMDTTGLSNSQRSRLQTMNNEFKEDLKTALWGDDPIRGLVELKRNWFKRANPTDKMDAFHPESPLSIEREYARKLAMAAMDEFDSIGRPKGILDQMTGQKTVGSTLTQETKDMIKQISEENKRLGSLIWAQDRLAKKINSQKGMTDVVKDAIYTIGIGTADFLNPIGIPKGVVTSVKLGNMFMKSDVGQFARVKFGDAGAKAVEASIEKSLKAFGNPKNLTKEQVAAISWAAAQSIKDLKDNEK